MKPLAQHERTPNLADRKARCRVCDDNGWATVGTSPHCGAEYDQMAPCPFCERGYRQEFPAYPADRAKREAWINTPWGDDGFWQGRDLPDHLVEQWNTARKPKPVPA